MKQEEMQAEIAKAVALGLEVKPFTEADLRQARVSQSFVEGDIIEDMSLTIIPIDTDINGTVRTVYSVPCKVTNKLGVSRKQNIAYHTLTGSLITEKDALTVAPQTPRFAALAGVQYEQNEKGEGFFPFHFKVKVDKTIPVYNIDFSDSPVYEDENGVKHYRTFEEPVNKGISTGANMIKH